jgi:hypothetical protein
MEAIDLLQAVLSITPVKIQSMSQENVDACLQSIKDLETASQTTWQMFQGLDSDKRPSRTMQLIRNYANGSVKASFDKFDQYMQMLTQRSSLFASLPPPAPDKKAQELLLKMQEPAQFYLEYQNQKQHLTKLTELLNDRREYLNQENSSVNSYVIP